MEAAIVYLIGFAITCGVIVWLDDDHHIDWERATIAFCIWWLIWLIAITLAIEHLFTRKTRNYNEYD